MCVVTEAEERARGRFRREKIQHRATHVCAGPALTPHGQMVAGTPTQLALALEWRQGHSGRAATREVLPTPCPRTLALGAVHQLYTMTREGTVPGVPGSAEPKAWPSSQAPGLHPIAPHEYMPSFCIVHVPSIALVSSR